MNKILTSLLLIFIEIGSFAQSYKFLTTADGLSNSLINKIIQDQYGFVWIATEDGLNCFDGNKIKVYRHSDNDSNSLANNFIRDIFIDSRGRLFVGTYKGMQIYNPLTDKFSKPARRIDGSTLNFSVMSFTELRNGTILALGDWPCSVELDPENNPVVKPYIFPAQSNILPADFLVEDNKGNIFVTDNTGIITKTSGNSSQNYYNNLISSTLTTNSKGEVFACSRNNSLLKYDAEADSFKYVVSGSRSLPFFSCAMYGNNQMLIGTDGNGLKIVDLQQNTLSHFNLSVPSLDDTKLKVHSIYTDRNGNIWLGLYQKGVLLLNSGKAVFNYIGNKSATANIIGQSCVSSLCLCNGMLWVATDNDGIYVVDIQNKKCIHHFNSNDFPTLIMTLFANDDRYVYVGSYGMGLWKIDAKTFKYNRIQLTNESLSNDFTRISHIQSLNGNTILFSSMGSGVGFLNTNNDKQVFYQNVNANINKWGGCVCKIRENGFAIGTYNGIYFVENYNGKQVFKHMFDRSIIFALLELDENRIVTATSNGLFLIVNNKYTNTYEYIPIEGTNNTSAFFSLTKDSINNIWVGSDHGLFRISIYGNNDYKVTGFSIDDGTVNGEFAKNAVCQAYNGTLFFGGFNGITYFKPEDTRKTSLTDNGIRLTRFYIRNQEVTPIDTSFPNQIISEPACKATTFYLQHNQNSFSIEFSPIGFFTSPNTQYYYRVNNDAPSIISHNLRQLSFVRMKPDVYNISIYSSTNGLQSQPYNIKVIIKHAWYNSLIAKIIYILLIISALAFIIMLVYRYGKNKQEINRHLQIQQNNQAKLRFFTNVIHEIRTPLSLIVGPLQKITEGNIANEYKNELHTICRGVDRMHKLVDSLLDIRKIDNGKMSLHLTSCNLANLITSNIDIFAMQAETKNVKLSFTNNLPQDFTVVTDQSAVEKILTNLLSNAMKFTDNGSEIEVKASLNEESFTLSVKDCGPGISQDDLNKIFDRFYQADSQFIQQGTGIGLDLSKALAELLNGTLSAQNRTDTHGAEFIFTHPCNLIPDTQTITQQVYTPDNSAIDRISKFANEPIVETRNGKVSGIVKKKIILVEDDPDIAEYISIELRNEYNILYYNNGETALTNIFSQQPDLIISDLMMPVLDGFELCKKIKQNININEIPVIILTAKTGDDVKISSLQSGADAFITKPFNIEVLKQTIKNLISTRHKLIVNYSGGQTPKEPVGLDVSKVIDPDEKLIKKIVKAIENNLSNEEYSTEMLAADVGLSRVHLYRKLKELTNQTGSEFIRNIRLKRASELIVVKKGFSMAEIADLVGFPNKAYFCVAFKNFYGISPSKWREMHTGESDSEPENDEDTTEDTEK